MMPPAIHEGFMQYRLSPSPNVSARSFGDEVIAANFVKGVYYSLPGPAAQIWEGLMAGVPLDRVAREVAALSSVEPAAFAAASDALVEALLAEGLIVPATDVEVGAWSAVPGSDGPYGAPVLERYTDMEDLLLLDPVHDVEDMGWPHVNPAAAR
jgi:hypothetical protein